MVDSVGKWAKGEQYGPVLSQTDLYLLGVPLEIHPILKSADASFHLQFDLTNGSTVGWDSSDRSREIPFTQRDQPATMPRVSQVIIITHSSPWCTVVMNDNGVTLGDVCIKLWQEYSQNNITDAEFNCLPSRMQEAVRRTAQHHAASQWPGGYYQPPAAQTNSFKRYDWLRDRTMFDRLLKEGQDAYIQSRLGFTAPNIFVMELM
ncbi:hypothetical protein D9611_004135 [Ephemerocybe angulata]|uniref:DUF6699 domain-containing protein n=2 Tax=Ephemerocybe angulata TaxID=980116 RepID=A0A8H6M7I0_9AGAR|nr:hypothetical protein D9611_004135 [Tulosesus angulatus]KAF6758718.1 hypothetical protein DFP72DRAFT_961892 [Tulosesus angulatus]KAF6764636.1 hypothetical protein DFP72DRAFT_954248 [Tulosesus angulatus]